MDANPLYLHKLARTGQLRQMTAQARAWAQGGERGLRDVVAANVVRPTLPLATERVTAALNRRGTVLGGLGGFARPRWLRRGFARAHGYRGASLAEARFVFGRRPEESLYDAANYIAAPTRCRGAARGRTGSSSRTLSSTPRSSPRCAACPAEAMFRPGRPKAVLREAMADLLPDGVRGRTAKIPFDQLYARGLHRHGDDLIDLCRSARHPLITEMFDVETLCQAVREARLGTGDAYSWDRLNSTLALVAWLEGLGRHPLPHDVAVPVSVDS
ncbi:asparagine synthase-related protein [Streptomyces tricolor]|nr:asparagine synthase-related protein [Streptomyces tricolor]